MKLPNCQSVIGTFLSRMLEAQNDVLTARLRLDAIEGGVGSGLKGRAIAQRGNERATAQPRVTAATKGGIQDQLGDRRERYSAARKRARYSAAAKYGDE